MKVSKEIMEMCRPELLDIHKMMSKGLDELESLINKYINQRDNARSNRDYDELDYKIRTTLFMLLLKAENIEFENIQITLNRGNSGEIKGIDNNIMDMLIEDTNLSARAKNAMSLNNIIHVRNLMQFELLEIQKFKNIGAKTINELCKFAIANKISFGRQK